MTGTIPPSLSQGSEVEPFPTREGTCSVAVAQLVSVHRLSSRLSAENVSDYMVYTRGSTEDFDRYAAVTGDSGWSWENALTYFKKV